jgi:hypothetical protein
MMFDAVAIIFCGVFSFADIQQCYDDPSTNFTITAADCATGKFQA